LFVAVSVIVSGQYEGIGNFDPLRIASQIIVGIGFIGAGLIIFKESKIQGLTTAAGLWIAAGIGVAAGFGFYAIAVFASILTLFVFKTLWFVENRVKRRILK
jgi:putative Mg2+ transporter-C (MgtC) family protein